MAKVIFNLYASGIGSGSTRVHHGDTIEFMNFDTRFHRLEVRPTGLVSSSRFSINPGGKVIIFVLRVPQETGGSIVDNPGVRQTVHDIIVLP